MGTEKSKVNSQTQAMSHVSDASHRFWSKVIRFREPLLLASILGHQIPAAILVGAIWNLPPAPLLLSNQPPAGLIRIRHPPLPSATTISPPGSPGFSFTSFPTRLFFYVLSHPKEAVPHTGKVWILKFADCRAPRFPSLLKSNQTHQQLKENS